MGGDLMKDYLETHLWKGTQSIDGEAVDAGHTPQLRAVVHRDSYDFQSYAKVEAWTDLGWKTILTRPIGATFVKNSSRHQDQDLWGPEMLQELESLIGAGRMFFAHLNGEE